MFENWDLAQVVLYLFWIFFAGLLFYLRREDRREGYPLESDTSPGRLLNKSLIFYPSPKSFALPHGGALRTVPTGRADARPIAAAPIARWPGAPLQPNDPMPLLAGVGPGSFAERSDTPDMTVENHPKIVPLRVAPAYAPASDTIDPRGFAVYGLDRALAGTVTDLWVDRSESVLRYLEVELTGAAARGKPTAGSDTNVGQGFEAKASPEPASVGVTAPQPAAVPPVASTQTQTIGIVAESADAIVVAIAEAPVSGVGGLGTGRILVPATFANVHGRRRTVIVKAVTGAQLAMAPVPASQDQVTMLEEEKIVAFFGAGMLYATPKRAEPLL